ncbi:MULTISPECIES: M23 family metallopeptidase [unclassified Sutcliffiella]|uniref:M23 family metallopeptidase n=1 Tax=unclassified Sutcliffiella TaxID=2837532 RepID=UPI0030CE4ED8
MKFKLTSEYGVLEQIRNGKPHTGIDLAMPEHTELRSIGEAIVERVGDYGNENIGKGVILRLEDGTTAIYGHMSDIKVKVGQILKEGETLGYSGNTGHSTGAHLHFGLKDQAGNFIDPTPLVSKLDSLSGKQSLLDKFVHNGTVGNTHFPSFPSIKEWVGDFIHSGIHNWIADFILTLPILLTVGLGVWALLGMMSKRLAELGFTLVLISGGLMLI